MDKNGSQSLEEIKQGAQGVIEQLWDIFSSSNLLTVALVLFVVLAVAGAIGRALSGAVRLALSATAFVVGVVIFIHVWQALEVSV